MSRRLFMALMPPAEIVEDLQDQLERTTAPAGHPRLLSPDSWHITCLFLGEVDRRRAELLLDAAEDRLTDSGRFTLNLAGAGAFPDPQRPRQLWVGVQSESDRLDKLFRICRSAARDAGISFSPAPQIPHLTVYRGRPAASPMWIDAFSSYRSPQWQAATVHLLESHLGKSGAHYSTVARYQL